MKKTSILSSLTLGAALLTVSFTPTLQVNAMADDGENPIQYKAKTNVQPNSGNQTVYLVKKGDTLTSIAHKNSMSYKDIMATNNLRTTEITINQKLILSTSAKISVQQTPKNSTYIVQQGDTLGSIADRHSTSYQQLMQDNHLTSTQLSIGQKLSLGSTPSIEGKTKQTSNPYTVQIGDTLSSIAQKFNTTSKDLMSLNGLTSTVIYENQQLEVKTAANRSYRSTVVKTTSKKQTTSTPKEIVSPRLANAAKIALGQLGVPYGYGQSSPHNAFDCSGLIAYALQEAGYNYGRMSASSYYGIGTTVNSPQYGDLVFFSNTYKSGISHVGFYIGNGQMVSAAGDEVQIDSIHSSYWSSHFTAYKRF